MSYLQIKVYQRDFGVCRGCAAGIGGAWSDVALLINILIKRK